ncbi:MAG: hypothetical protein IKG46_04215 [Solobacterium sp.]|nr:hypothetical protein [Solobacterium sp.]
MTKTTLKHLLCSTLALALLGGCSSPSSASQVSSDSEKQEQQTPAPEPTPEPTPSQDGERSLVVYFSRTGEQYGVGVIEKGNTAIVAEILAEETGSDLFEILPAEDSYPYTYDELIDVAKKEQAENARPAYAGTVPDLSQYSAIYIGSPVWWGDWPMILYTFFENNAEGLAGKTLYPFCTHAGSGLAGFDQKLSRTCPDSTVGEGLAIAGTTAQSDADSVRSSVQDWVKRIR